MVLRGPIPHLALLMQVPILQVSMMAHVPVSLAWEEDLRLVEDLAGEAGASVALGSQLVRVSDVVAASAHHLSRLHLQVAWVATWVEACLRL